MQDQLGNDSYPITYSCDGQPVTEFDSCIGFVLMDDYFRKAGEFCWPEELTTGELDKPGISLNRAIFSRLCKHYYSETPKPLIVYNVERNEFYKLTDYEVVFENVEFWEQHGKELVVTPLDAYEEIDLDDVPAAVQKLAEKHH